MEKKFPNTQYLVIRTSLRFETYKLKEEKTLYEYNTDKHCKTDIPNISTSSLTIYGETHEYKEMHCEYHSTVKYPFEQLKQDIPIPKCNVML